MGTGLSVNEYALLEFFEVIPTTGDHDISWDYNDSAYEVTRDNVRLIFAVVPVSRDVRVVLKIGEHVVYHLNAMGVEDIKHHSEKGRESLEVVLAPRDSLWIRLKPEISLHHSMAERA
jgi:hypothetical protein